MRARAEIEAEKNTALAKSGGAPVTSAALRDGLLLEVLLDIRDLLDAAAENSRPPPLADPEV